MDKKERFLNIQKVFILIFYYSLLMIFSSCQKLEDTIFYVKDFFHMLFPVEEFQPCDPFFNYYENKKHYFSDYFLKEGNIDYKKLLEMQKKLYLSNCDPLKSN